MKRLRGTPFDLFGWDRDRRLERAVIDEYEALVRGALGDPSIDHDTVARLASSPQAIKGYGAIKEQAVATWRSEINVGRTRDEVTIP